jgi:hypothetical protein
MGIEYTINEVMKMIGRNEVYLPAIQRKFVWDYEQIESLFDSTMRNYPIGTFLFWFVRGETKNKYTFYKFLQNYHERDNKFNEIAPKPELKEEIEAFLKSINKKGGGFSFDNDFIMRSCLFLTDCPVLFKVKSFKKENIEKIKNEWKNIKSAISKSIDLLVEFGFSGENLTSQNAVLPIAYHFMKGGNESTNSISEMRKYLIYAMLKQVYGSHGDQVLTILRDALRMEEDNNYILLQTEFSLIARIEKNLPGNKSFEITNEDIEEILQYKKGSYTFMVLSLLYPNLRFGQIKFHQDHIHPASLFTDAKLKKYNIPETKWKEWQEMKDQLPNLQLMEGEENKSKNDTLFKEWLEGTDSNNTANVVDMTKFKIDNYIPENINIGLENFEEFYTKRMSLLRTKIENVLGVMKPPETS